MKEEEIRPAALFEEYLRLAGLDARELFDENQRVDVSCPACSEVGASWFEKDSFSYKRCGNCFSVFVSPRPSDEQIRGYYTTSRSAKFWATDFYVQTAESRREKIWPDKVRKVLEICSRFERPTATVVDIGGGYGIFAELIRDEGSHNILVVEPSSELAAHCRNKGLPVLPKFMEDVESSDLPEGSRVFTSFELLEHLQNPQLFLRQVSELMSEHDLLVMTSLSSLGIDILSLGSRSKSISPPHHINFFNPISIPILLETVGLEALEVSTPGRLDVSILENSLDDVDSLFLRTFLQLAGADAKAGLQRFLAEGGWSSHVLFVARKRCSRP